MNHKTILLIFHSTFYDKNLVFKLLKNVKLCTTLCLDQVPPTACDTRVTADTAKSRDVLHLFNS